MTSEPPSGDLGALDQYFGDLAECEPFKDREAEREMARRAQQGDREAAQRLVEANLRFVVSYVKRYQDQGLSLKELVSAGNVGLLKAVQKFDPDRGVKFISYAVWWIRQTVLQALAEEGGSTAIPESRNSQLYQLSRAEQRLTQELGRPPTDHEVAEELGERVEIVRLLREVDRPPVRFDAPLDETQSDSATFHEQFADTDEEELERDVEEHIRREILEELFAEHLTDRERKILVLYYGLDDGEPYTLEEIGQLMGVSRERIRQLRNRAFEKLQEAEQGKALEEFWSQKRAS